MDPYIITHKMKGLKDMTWSHNLDMTWSHNLCFQRQSTITITMEDGDVSEPFIFVPDFHPTYDFFYCFRV